MLFSDNITVSIEKARTKFDLLEKTDAITTSLVLNLSIAGYFSIDLLFLVIFRLKMPI